MSDPEKYEEHCTRVAIYEDQRNGLAPKPKRARSREGLDDAEMAPEPAEALQSTLGTNFETRKFLGILWPVDVWKREYPEDPKPPTKLIEKHKHNGEWVRGVIRDRKHGLPIGAIELWQCAHTGIVQTKEVFNSKDYPLPTTHHPIIYDLLANLGAVRI